MYKGSSRSLQRKHRVIEIRKPSTCYLADDDLIQSAANMGLDECREERRQLLVEKTQRENQLVAAKNSGDMASVTHLGARLQGIGLRVAMLKDRMKILTGENRNKAFGMALREFLDDQAIRKLFDRRDEIARELEHAEREGGL